MEDSDCEEKLDLPDQPNVCISQPKLVDSNREAPELEAPMDLFPAHVSVS
jgi:hypothetical protein